MDPTLSLPACRQADYGTTWMLEHLLELPGTAKESSLFEEGCMAERLTLLPHQRAQAGLSTGAGGLRMSSVEAKSMPASVGSLVTTPPTVLVDLSGSLGEKVRGNVPGSELVTSILEGVRGLRDDGGVTEEMGEVVPRGWRDRSFRPEELSASGSSDREVLAAHDAETTNSYKAQNKIRKQVNMVRYDRYVTSLDELPTDARPPEGIGKATESVRARSCRVVTNEAGGR